MKGLFQKIIALYRRRLVVFSVLLTLITLSLLAEVLFGGANFTPGEEILSQEIESVTVSPDNTRMPPDDVQRFSKPPQVIYLYLMLRDLPYEGNVEVKVERVARGSVLSLLLVKPDPLRVMEEGEEPNGNGRSSRVLKFALRTSSGGPLHTGDYAVTVYISSPGEPGMEAARKFFVIED